MQNSDLKIQDVFENQVIFITGATGFIGKVLVEKILYSCPGVKKIYVLIRARKNKSAQERMENWLKLVVYDRLRNKYPDALKKVELIEGDCMELGLGISSTDLQKLQEVNIVYHTAASVRFDDPFREAILMNTRSSYELIKLTEVMQNLKLFVHVSTTYCNPDKAIVEEKVYPPYADWRVSIKLAETYNEETLDILYAKYSDHQPNTYTFTKSLSEQIILEYKDKLPVMIFRPSIVTSSVEEPIPGWVDNFNGPMGLLVACGIGIMRTNYGNPDIVSDFLPVDLCVRSMLASTYAFLSQEKIRSDNLVVINAATSNIRCITQGDIIEIGKKIVREKPFEHGIWVPGGNITRCYFWNLIRMVFFQIIPAIVLDSLLKLTGHKPFLLKIQRRIFATNIALHVFLNTTWDFKNDGFYEVGKLIPKCNIEDFGYLHYAYTVDFEETVRRAAKGARMFLLKEPAEVSRGAQIRLKFYMTLDFIFKMLFCFFCIRFIYNYVSAFLQKYGGHYP